ncbi:hypothetical protein P154DRAFT_573644 [Amniculicola lignicola CBS 123094]|uniref:Uncharacterized protein n=1 Tax=Amniculicola lignicola CBS 123094 TaxID=1392246 RepID=A0A6A5WPJ7_9PLEO|nr:hypothetical protein P154DRAFT_573644 [Amniculicola lignicola CBS 123094]
MELACVEYDRTHSVPRPAPPVRVCFGSERICEAFASSIARRSRERAIRPATPARFLLDNVCDASCLALQVVHGATTRRGHAVALSMAYAESRVRDGVVSGRTTVRDRTVDTASGHRQWTPPADTASALTLPLAALNDSASSLLRQMCMHPSRRIVPAEPTTPASATRLIPR